jgi:hypothetical protein
VKLGEGVNEGDTVRVTVTDAEAVTDADGVADVEAVQDGDMVNNLVRLNEIDGDED